MKDCLTELAGGLIWVAKEGVDDLFWVGEMIRFPTGRVYRVSHEFKKDGHTWFGLRVKDKNFERFVKG